MQIIDRAKERLQAQKAGQEKREQVRLARDLLLAEKSKPTELHIDRSTWHEFLQLLKNKGIANFYGNELPGGAFYLDEQISLAEQLLNVSIRDRKQLESLVIDEYKPHHHNIPLRLPTDPETINILTKEANKLRIDYMTYLRAIFRSRVEDISQRQHKLEEEQERQMFDNQPVKAEGYIKKDLRKKLEGKYGQPEGNQLFGIQTYSYFNMLLELADEYFQEEQK